MSINTRFRFRTWQELGVLFFPLFITAQGADIFSLDLPAQSVEIKPSGVLVHSHITPISFYISGIGMRTKQNFIL